MDVQASRLADSSVKDFAKFRALQKQGEISYKQTPKFDV